MQSLLPLGGFTAALCISLTVLRWGDLGKTMAALNASAGLRIKSLLLSLSHCSLYLSFACYPCRIVLCTCPLLLCLCCYRCPLFFVSFLCSCTCSLYLSVACNFTLASATMWATFYDDDLCTCPLLLYLFFVLVLCLQFCIGDDDDCFTHRITLGMCVCVSPHRLSFPPLLSLALVDLKPVPGFCTVAGKFRAVPSSSERFRAVTSGLLRSRAAIVYPNSLQ